MSYDLSVSIVDRGNPPLSKALEIAPAKATEALKRAVNKASLTIEREAKARAPRRTGTLARSIHTELATSSIHAVTGKVGTNLSYAVHQEYGVRPFGVRRAKALRFNVGGKVVFAKRVRGFKGRFYFKGAIEAARPKITQFFEEAVSEVVGLLRG